ncbi:hypothetical protein M427DRAFT_60263, partial [Gonapodya prolifera JEL478]
MEGALSMLKAMLADGLEIKEPQFQIFLTMMAKSAKKDGMQLVISYMSKSPNFKERSLTRPAIWHVVAQLYSRLGMWKDVLSLWDEVTYRFRKGDGVYVNGRLATLVLDSLGHCSRPMELAEFWEHLRSEFPELLRNENVWNSRIEALMRFGDVDHQALRIVIREMPSAGVEPSPKTVLVFLFPLLTTWWKGEYTTGIVRKVWTWCEQTGKQDSLRKVVRQVEQNSPHLALKRLRMALSAVVLDKYR